MKKSSKLRVGLKELVEKYQNIFLDNTPTGRGTSANIKITTRNQVKGDSAIDTVIRQLQRRCNEFESSPALPSNAPTVTQPYKGTWISIGRY